MRNRGVIHVSLFVPAGVMERYLQDSKEHHIWEESVEASGLRLVVSRLGVRIFYPVRGLPEQALPVPEPLKMQGRMYFTLSADEMGGRRVLSAWLAQVVADPATYNALTAHRLKLIDPCGAHARFLAHGLSVLWTDSSMEPGQVEVTNYQIVAPDPEDRGRVYLARHQAQVSYDNPAVGALLTKAACEGCTHVHYAK